jgi:hypothetical protein
MTLKLTRFVSYVRQPTRGVTEGHESASANVVLTHLSLTSASPLIGVAAVSLRTSPNNPFLDADCKMLRFECSTSQ